MVVRVWIGFSWRSIQSSYGSCKHGHEPSGSMKDGTIISWLTVWLLTSEGLCSKGSVTILVFPIKPWNCSRMGPCVLRLWWAKWHWDSFFSEFFDFPPSVSFHRAVRTHISGGWIVPLVSAVQRHCLTPLTWTTNLGTEPSVSAIKFIYRMK
jgi:hypothetical protein